MSRRALTGDGAIYPALQACQLLFMYRQEEVLTLDISDWQAGGGWVRKWRGKKKERKRGRALSALSWQEEPPRSFVCANQPCAKSSSSADLLCCVTAIDLMKGINTGRPHGQRRPHKSSGLPQCWCCLYFGPADVLPGELCVRVVANKIKPLYPHTPHLSGNTDRAHLRARSFISADGGDKPWAVTGPAVGHSMWFELKLMSHFTTAGHMCWALTTSFWMNCYGWRI